MGYRNETTVCVCVRACARKGPCVRVYMLHVRGDHSEARAGGLLKFIISHAAQCDQCLKICP